MKLTNKEASEWLMAIKRDYIYGGDEDYDERRKIALDMGAEALKNQKAGYWIMQGLSPYEGFIRCSECGAVYDIKRVFKYCPNCGAKMEDRK